MNNTKPKLKEYEFSCAYTCTRTFYIEAEDLEKAKEVFDTKVFEENEYKDSFPETELIEIESEGELYEV